MSTKTALASMLEERVRTITRPMLEELKTEIRGEIRVIKEQVHQEMTLKLRDLIGREIHEFLLQAVIENKAPAAPTKPGRRNQRGVCNVQGCGQPHAAKGYCDNHYHAGKRFGWPLQAPKNFVPPPRPFKKRGGLAKIKTHPRPPVRRRKTK